MNFIFKKWLSYIVPITIYKTDSIISKSIEVTWNNGQLVLDTQNTNYSYGSLQRILHKGLKQIGFTKIKSMQNLLVLGVAGGSVVKTLVNEIKFTNSITGVELDSDIIKIANQYFELQKIKNLKIIIQDANNFVLQNNKKYDLIVVDIFEDNKMPDFLYETNFINALSKSLKVNGFILFNTMVLNNNYNNNLSFKNHFNNACFTIKTLSNLEYYNELILIEKLKKANHN